MKPGIKEHVGEWIALFVTVVLGIVFVSFAALMTYSSIVGKPVDESISVHFGGLMVAFVAVWRTNFGGGSTTVNTEQANVSAGGGSPAPANVETMVMEAAPGPAPAEEPQRGLNGP